MHHALDVCGDLHHAGLQRRKIAVEESESLLEGRLLAPSLAQVLLQLAAQIRIVLQTLDLAFGELDRLALQGIGVAKPSDEVVPRLR